MSAGTLTLTNNSAAVSGNETAFTTDLTVGDFIATTVGGITYTLPVKSVESATSLTLISKYTGPTQSGVAWSAVPRAAQNQITAALVAQTTEALRGLNSDKQNWQAVFSDSGDITVILPDGSSFTGPSWKKISDLLADIDLSGLQQIADQVSANAQQVATDRLDVDAKATQVAGDANTANQAATNAAAANTTAQQAKTDAVAANTAAQQAKTDAQTAAASINFNLTDVRNIIDAICPVGMMIHWPTATLPDDSTIGVKYLRLNGASFSKTLYPKLGAIYTSGVLPDMRGDTVRGYDDGRGVDQGRALLSEQLDAAPEISGSLVCRAMGSSGAEFGALTSATGAMVYSLISAGGVGVGAGASLTKMSQVSLAASLSNASYGRDGATEVRMRNMAWNMIVRAS
ncbi:phage tail protein [Kosakonia sacchari]|uniref:phage tail protein n=1 Tax=Kosakonia sacchari TaxID=1158459 RepID=UPI0028AF5E9C|nr:phage tail protein [Kosakonia sacchari]